MNRRELNLLLVGAGAVAAGAGLGWQLWRGSSGLPAGTEEGQASLWQARFTQPDGGVLEMAALRGVPLVLNFWATWCPPCVREMPELDRFARQFAAQGVRVVGLAVDSPAAVREFLARSPVSYTIGLAGFAGTDLSRKLGNESGALPFTVVLDRGGRVVQRRLGETSFEQLSRWVAPL
ncbi:MAG: TlpA disulfide reductase family protein [Rubrivivax sp.]|nr:TlpA disulfide reductase family protein [Rubrivivax sp.]